MSEIRMCDHCGEIFSLRQKGWEEYLRRVDRPASNGNTHEAMHICPKHRSTGDDVAPRLSLTASSDAAMADPTPANPYLEE